MRKLGVGLMLSLWLSAYGALAGELPAIAADPYLGAIVVEVGSGEVLFEDNADAVGYPASVIKLLSLLVVIEKVDEGSIKLDDMVLVSAEAAGMGGSQVFLKEHETFTVDDLLYALIVQSANDAAAALAEHVAGGKDAFVRMMAARAAELGMSATEINSVHGLPPSEGQRPDLTTARDLATLSRELLKHPSVLRYTSTREQPFRGGEFVMRTHNPLLLSLPGCDGFKTGYFKKAGYSISATMEKNGNRLIAVVLDSQDREVRNRKAREMLTEGFRELARRRRAQFANPAGR